MDRGADVPYVLSWQLEDLLALGQILAYAALLIGPRGDILDCQSLVVWDLYMPDLGALDALLPASHQIFQVVNRDQI